MEESKWFSLILCQLFYAPTPIWPFNRKWKDPLYFFPLPVQIWMNIALKRDCCAGMAQQFTQRFDIAPSLQADGCKGMAQNMWMNPADFGLFQIALDTFPITARFYGALFIPGKKPCGIRSISSKFSEKLYKWLLKGNLTVGTSGFGRLYYNLCMPITAWNAANGALNYQYSGI